MSDALESNAPDPVASATSPTVDDALSGLVSQFSSALDCYRELVQNSIDAGSPRIDVWMEYLSGGHGKGTIAIHVDDFGEGMDETIIDTQLTRLFSSSKENDLTKIGKFGIGFVSVFALNPKAVLVHTGRGGEYWEVLFYEDRTFSKSPLETPVDGTQITLFIEGNRRRYGELVRGSRDTLARWCAHSDTEVTFEDRTAPSPGVEQINRAFAVDGEVMTTATHQGTEIVLAYTQRPIYGFYNKGLTLLSTSDAEEALGEEGARFRQIAFRIKSRYLEHTLSRETILRDTNYEKAVTLLREAADERLFKALIDALLSLATASELDLQAYERYMRLLAFLAGEPPEILRDYDDITILRTVDGRAVDLGAVATAASSDGRVYVASKRSALTDILTGQGVPVVLGRRRATQTGEETDRGTDPVRRLILTYLVSRDRRSLCGRFFECTQINLRASVGRPEEWLSYDPVHHYGSMLADPHQAYVAVDLIRPRSVVRDLISGAAETLAAAGSPYAELSACRLESPEADPPLFLIGRKLGRVMARPPRRVAEPERPKRPRAAVNVEHPQFVALARLYRVRPAMAAYCLAKDLLLAEDRLLNLDTDLMEAAIASRPARGSRTDSWLRSKR